MWYKSGKGPQLGRCLLVENFVPGMLKTHLSILVLKRCGVQQTMKVYKHSKVEIGSISAQPH